jgi:hypothetical protein
MTTTYQQFVDDLHSIPDKVFIDFLIECKKIYMRYSKEGLFNFIKGHKVEHEFVKCVGSYINLRPSKKQSPDDPDCVYNENYLPDIKTKQDGLKTKKNSHEFYAKPWILKNPYSNKNVFVTRADSYILIDPTCSKIAVVDSKHFSGSFNNQNSTTCQFNVCRDQVDMIFDGTGKIPYVEPIQPISEYDLMELIP